MSSHAPDIKLTTPKALADNFAAALRAEQLFAASCAPASPARRRTPPAALPTDLEVR